MKFDRIVPDARCAIVSRHLARIVTQSNLLRAYDSFALAPKLNAQEKELVNGACDPLEADQLRFAAGTGQLEPRSLQDADGCCVVLSGFRDDAPNSRLREGPVGQRGHALAGVSASPVRRARLVADFDDTFAGRLPLETASADDRVLGAIDPIPAEPSDVCPGSCSSSRNKGRTPLRFSDGQSSARATPSTSKNLVGSCISARTSSAVAGISSSRRVMIVSMLEVYGAEVSSATRQCVLRCGDYNAESRPMQSAV